MKRRIISLFLVLAGIFTITVTPSLAIESQSNLTKSKKTVVNEYEAFKYLQTATAQELYNAGYTQNEVKVLKEFNYESALLERAKESEVRLTAYGYSNEEILILKSLLKEGAKVTEDILLALAAECETWYKCDKASVSSISLAYCWNWNKIPFFTHSDAVALRWRGVSEFGTNLILRRVAASCSIDYYYIASGQKEVTRSNEVVPDSGFDAVHTEFSLLTQKFDESTEAWAKGGNLSVTLERTGTLPIQFINVLGEYGHTVASFIGSISVTYPPDFAISFSPALSTEALGIKLAEIYPNKKIIYI